VIIICCLKLGKIRDNCMPGRMSELRPETEKIEVLIQGIENRDEDIERLTALAYERQEIIKEQVEEISKREHGWKLLYKEKDKQIAELKARVSELEGALRLCLAVSPDDPLITPGEKAIVTLRDEKRDNLIVEQGMQLEQINNVLDGEEVCDFALSFPTINKVERLMQMRDGLRENKLYLENDLALKMQEITTLKAEMEEFKVEHFRTEGESHQTPCTWGILCPYCKIIELRVEVDRLRDALKKIARGSDDVDSSGEKSLPFDGDYAQTVAQAALKEAADA